MFSDKELAYLRTQRLARIATSSTRGQPDVAPVGYEFDGTAFYIGSVDMERTIKYKNILENSKVALVVDDLEAIDPWKPRGMKFHATATIEDREGAKRLRLRPERYWSWGIDASPFESGKPVIKKQRLS